MKLFKQFHLVLSNYQCDAKESVRCYLVGGTVDSSQLAQDGGSFDLSACIPFAYLNRSNRRSVSLID